MSEEAHVTCHKLRATTSLRGYARHAYPYFGLLNSRLKCDWVPWIVCHFSRLLHEHRKRGFLKHFRQSELHVHLKGARNVLIM